MTNQRQASLPVHPSRIGRTRTVARPPKAVVAIAALALTLAACGGSEVAAGAPGPAPVARLGDTVLTTSSEATAAMAAASFEGHVTVPSSDETGDGLRIDFHGAYDLARPASSLTAELTAGEATGASSFADLGPIELRSVGAESFVRGGPLALLGGDQLWMALPTQHGAADETDPLERLGPALNPGQLLDRLEETPATVEELGHESVRGVETRHLRVTVSAADLHAATGKPAIPGAESPDTDLPAEHDLGRDTTVPIELWLDDAGAIHRMTTSLSLPMAVPGLVTAGSTIEIAIELFDLGQVPDIETPPDAEIISGLDLGLGD